MALLTKQEFADRCGIETKALSVYISRKKVIVGENDLIDDRNDKNRVFLEKRQAKAVKLDDVPPQQIPREETWIDPDLAENENDPYDISSIPPLLVSERLLKHLDTQKRTAEISLLRIKEEKIKGTVIPSELVQPIVLQHNQHILMEQKNSDEEMLAMFAHKYSISGEDVAYIRGEWVKRRNSAIKTATEGTIKSVEAIIKDFSEKRGAGDRS
jgi:hypothetical protein